MSSRLIKETWRAILLQYTVLLVLFSLLIRGFVSEVFWAAIRIESIGSPFVRARALSGTRQSANDIADIAPGGYRIVPRRLNVDNIDGQVGASLYRDSACP